MPLLQDIARQSYKFESCISSVILSFIDLRFPLSYLQNHNRWAGVFSLFVLSSRILIFIKIVAKLCRMYSLLHSHNPFITTVIKMESIEDIIGKGCRISDIHTMQCLYHKCDKNRAHKFCHCFAEVCYLFIASYRQWIQLAITYSQTVWKLI